MPHHIWVTDPVNRKYRLKFDRTWLEQLQNAHISFKANHRRRNRGGTGGMRPQDFAINEEVPFLFSETVPFSLRKKCPRSVVPHKFEMLPTSLKPTPLLFSLFLQTTFQDHLQHIHLQRNHSNLFHNNLVTHGNK